MIRILLTVLAFTACFQAQAHQREGGVTGGGGNLLVNDLPTKSLNPEYVEHQLHKLKPKVLEFIGEQERVYREGLMSNQRAAVFRVLFEGRQNLREKLKDVTIFVDEEAPCFDHRGEAYDGTYVKSEKSSMCLSAHRIARKVVPHELIPQAAALMVHEFSEIMGLDDADAISIQAQALEDLSNAQIR